MGSDDVCLQPNGFHLNGLLPNKAASMTRELDLERWSKAEARTAELMARIQPDQPSCEHRNAIASYVQGLIVQSIPCMVFSYGSVPLKTYLPDGDIDLTVFSQDRNFNDNWATEVRDMLEKEENNVDAEYRIREVQLIHAEVKLVKCLVDNIVVDISFCQLRGLCTLCFLEQVDRYINQNHLFKRSIILIKAWCYYESRLLGAYHGLVSTYALETMILYIFRVFNNSFAGPLEVLYRFLEFFSKFDWDNFCISLLGPVPIRFLPDITAYPPRNDGDELLLSKMFLDTCSLYYSVIPSTHESREQFVSKHLNIIDFLRTNNNLGRSVSRGNFFRIRSAFAFGAQRLAVLLDCPKEHVVTELNRFFVNTWDRHGKVDRPDKHIIHVSELRQDNLEHNVQRRRSSKGTNSMASEEGNMRLKASHKPLTDGERRWQSNDLQNGVQFVHQFARTCSSPELTNASGDLLHRGTRGRLQEKSIPESDHSGKTGQTRVGDSRDIKVNAADPSPRETSPSESYDGDVESSSASSTYHGDYATGEGISSGAKPIQKSANMMHSPRRQTFGGQFQVPAFKASHIPVFPSPEAQRNLNFNHRHHLASVPVIGRSNGHLLPEVSNKPVDHDGFCDHDASSTEHNLENRLFCSESMERKQNLASFSCSYDSSGQPNIFSHYEDKKRYGLVTENEESVGKYDDGIKFLCTSFNTSTTEVSFSNSQDGSPLMRNDSLKHGVGTTSEPVIVDRSQCLSQENNFEKFCHEVKGSEVGVPFSKAETTIPPIAVSHIEALQIPTFSPTNLSYPSRNWVFPVMPIPLHPQSWPTASSNYPVFPVQFLPAGPVFPSVATPPYLAYTSQCEGKGVIDGSATLDTADSFDQQNNSSMSKVVNGIGSAQHSEECTFDILSGDFASHLNNMIYGRSCQNSQLQGPLVYQPSILPAQYLQEQFLLGDPGRSSSSTASDTIFSETPPAPISHHHSNQKSFTGGHQHYPKGNPKHGMGTGTYLPHLESLGDFQSSSSRYHRRNYRYHRKEKHKEQEVNPNFNSKPRYTGRSRQWEKNSRFDLSAARNNQAHMQWRAFRSHSPSMYQSMGYGPTYVVHPYDPNPAYGPIEHPPADSANSSPDRPS